MGGDEAVGIFVQIRSLVSDRLQVISYKWLSRNFSVSSNDAKRFLNKFVEKHGNDLQVLYAISGWLKDNPKSYSVKLAAGSKLEETRKEFEEISSVQVYSVQASIPFDTSVIWNSEFVQAEEFFNQPSTQDNCLRDNRFCAVSNSFVERTTNGNHTTPLPPKAKNVSPIKPKSDAFQKDLQALKPPKQEPVSNSDYKSEKDTSVSVSKPSIVKEASKVKGPKEKSASGNGGSLASMWGRASTKPKPVKETSDDSPSIAGTSDGQICAKEDEHMASSDEEQELNFKSKNRGANRKRRVIFDFSDDENENEPENAEEEEENIISLASPEPPKKPEITNIPEITKKAEITKQPEITKKLEITKKPEIAKNPETVMIKEEKKTENQKEEEVRKSGSVDKGKDDSKTGSGSLKRRKVLKKRIDEKGREVSEFVWEGEQSPSDEQDQDNTGNRLPNKQVQAISTDKDQPNTTNNKTPPSASSTVNKPVGNKKPAKAGAKDAKQGNILSFFKKI